MKTSKGASYKVLAKNCFVLEDLTLRPITEYQMDSIRKWRNSQVPVLRQNSTISWRNQRAYFNKRVFPEMGRLKPAQILFAIERCGSFVGYGGLTKIDWVTGKAEISFLLNPSIKEGKDDYLNIFDIFLRLVTNVAFDDLVLSRLFTETFSSRVEHIAILKNNGFILEGRLRQHCVVDGVVLDSLMHGKLKQEDTIL